ncbi:exosome component 10-like protein [Dinothrombium tinctorium]|uniref:Exosome component 10-like protein n=1 Tax=Dinothrombium tinctorium TaxID=1965070 RepID=A0A3S3PJ91_9ACAR|nr:exosome component 10-like protein [Dinothrombium tinctorium]RWS16867.1 exosome component 10-like protein [Dinothrombium tinctorium]
MNSNESEENSEIPNLCQSIQKAVLNATKVANSIPLSEFTFYSSFNVFSKVMQHEKKSIDAMVSSLLKNNGMKTFEKRTEIDDKFDVLCDANDVIVDRINNLLDDAQGLKKKDEELIIATLNVNKNTHSLVTQSTASWNKQIGKKQEGIYNLFSAKTIQRPQAKFKDKIDNSNCPFVPRISEKPNSIKPLAILPEIGENGETTYSHPYEFEIEKFEILEHTLVSVTPKIPKPLRETPLHYISTLSELHKMISKLKTCIEIAVDLEHHSYRSFQGFTCLMQISTREDDFIIDTLELRSELHCLNEVFTDPKVVKVFHGADMDVVWLQRDFGVYVVNMFDTGQAAKLLNFAHFSLAYLLKHYCGLETNKKFQLADWRMRPLPDEMVQYAREDTHYLLYVYDRMKNDLISKGNANNNLLRCAFDRSRQVCLKKYEKPLFSESSYLSLVKKSKTILNSRQLFALRELCAWRDKIARLEDESTGYVLPNHMILHIAEVLPRNRSNTDIKVTNELGTQRRPIDLDNFLYSKQDITYIAERGQNLNTLLETGKGDDIDYEKHAENQSRIQDQKYVSLLSFFMSSKSNRRKIKNASLRFINLQQQQQAQNFNDTSQCETSIKSEDEVKVEPRVEKVNF